MGVIVLVFKVQQGKENRQYIREKQNYLVLLSFDNGTLDFCVDIFGLLNWSLVLGSRYNIYYVFYCSNEFCSLIGVIRHRRKWTLQFSILSKHTNYTS